MQNIIIFSKVQILMVVYRFYCFLWLATNTRVPWYVLPSSKPWLQTSQDAFVFLVKQTKLLINECTFFQDGRKLLVPVLCLSKIDEEY